MYKSKVSPILYRIIQVSWTCCIIFFSCQGACVLLVNSCGLLLLWEGRLYFYAAFSVNCGPCTYVSVLYTQALRIQSYIAVGKQLDAWEQSYCMQFEQQKFQPMNCRAVYLFIGWLTQNWCSARQQGFSTGKMQPRSQALRVRRLQCSAKFAQRPEGARACLGSFIT